MSIYKRKYRELSDETRERISKSNKGKKKGVMHRQKLSQSLKKYWQGVPSRAENLAMDEYFGLDKNNECQTSNTQCHDARN